jgi:hypothetical protein
MLELKTIRKSIVTTHYAMRHLFRDLKLDHASLLRVKLPYPAAGLHELDRRLLLSGAATGESAPALYSGPCCAAAGAR